ncbi:MAG: type II secretion system F family protein [Candidatus Aenigmatarchaeota archaeon]
MKKRMVRLFADWGIKHFPGKFDSLRKRMSESGIGIFFETYVGRMLVYAFFTLVISFFYLLIMLTIFGISILISLVSAVCISILSAGVILGIFYSYPIQIIQSKKKSIEANLPFATNHMAAIASSGIPPHAMFKLLTDAEEYGEIANQAKKIVRNMDVFGMDVSSAVREVADRSPSRELKDFLNGMVATITTGGDLKKYMENASQNALLDYKIKRGKYLESLSLYADVYIMVLIAAPLFFVSILSLMAIIGGTFLGFQIPFLMAVGVYFIIPLLNIIFILFIHFTQPVV